jgi:hypothetical protein
MQWKVASQQISVLAGVAGAWGECYPTHFTKGVKWMGHGASFIIQQETS